MKKIVLSFVMLFTLSNVIGQSKDTTITWYSIPWYDTLADGRIKLRTYKYEFDHIPTREDTLNLQAINKMLYKRLPVKGKTKKVPSRKQK